MAGKHRRRSRRSRWIRSCLPAVAVVLVLIAGLFGSQFVEKRLSTKVENAGQQMTAHTDQANAAQVFMNGQWFAKKDVETLLVMGVDDFGAVVSSDSYNNTSQADFLVLFIVDKETGRTGAIHINRDTMTDINVLGLTGQKAGVIRAQLALAFNYGRGEADSCRNTADAVSNLLYGMNVDRYITVTMDAVPVMNDWVGGVSLEVLDDLKSIDPALELGKEVTLQGDQALAYVRSRQGLADSTNMRRMERQRQYASAWVNQAQNSLRDADKVTQLVIDMEEHHYSDCTVEEMIAFADSLGNNPSIRVYELPGESVAGETYMEFHADDEGIQQLVLDLFYQPVQ